MSVFIFIFKDLLMVCDLTEKRKETSTHLTFVKLDVVGK